MSESKTNDAADSVTARQVDRNGFVTIERNVITRAGVFQYPGSKLPDGDPARIYNVYRSVDEVTHPDALASFRLLPLINEHKMLGEGYEGEVSDKEKHGTTGENISVEGNDVFASIRIFSQALRTLIESGKKGLSLGYRCAFEKIAGEFNGIRYDYIQKDIRGNHLALVNEGRCGTAVLDENDCNFAMDHFDLALDTGELVMADKDEDKKVAAKDNDECMTMDEMSKEVRRIGTAMDEFIKAGAEKEKAEDAEEEKEKEKAEDADCDEDKKAEDAEEKADEKKKDAMDEAIKTRIASLESRVLTEKAMRAQIKATELLAGRIAAHVGTFDNSAMDEADVVAYGCEKFGIKKSREALDGYLAAKAKPSAAVGFAMDSASPKAGGLLAKRINGAQA